MRSRISSTSSALENESITRYPGTKQRDYELGFLLRYEQRHSTPIAGRPGARGRGNRHERAVGALTIGLEEAELVGGEATGRRHGGVRRQRRRRRGEGLAGTVE